MENQNIQALFKAKWDENSDLSITEVLLEIKDEVGLQKPEFYRFLDQEPLGYGEYFCPEIISNFVSEYLTAVEPNNILDPFANFGELLSPLTELVPPEKIHGIDPLPNHAKIIDSVFNSETNWIVGDPLEEIRNKFSSISFDAIVSCPPFGKDRDTYKISHWKKDGMCEVQDSYSNALILESLKKLDQDGVGCFVVPEGFIHRNKRHTVLHALNDFGFYIHAVISVPAGTFSVTSISTLLLIIKRKKTQTVFVGELTKDHKSRQSLLNNLRKRKEAAEPQVGALVPQDDLKTVNRLILKKEIEKKAKRRGLQPRTLSNSATIKRVPRNSDIKDFPNAIYLFPHPEEKPAVKSLEEYEGSGRHGMQLILDTDKVSPDFITSFFNTQFGKKILEYHSRGPNIQRVSKKTLAELTLYLPKYETQKEFMKVKRKIQKLDNQLGRLEKNLWKKPHSYSEIESEIAKFNLDEEELFEKIIDNLPFPLGSILWVYQACDDIKEKVNHLLNFFEATAEFTATILLSAFQSDRELFRKKIKGEKPNQSLTRNFAKASFGNWVGLGKTLSKEIRRMRNNSDVNLVSELFGGAEDRFIKSISNKEFFRILDTTREYRNTWKGHDGLPLGKELEDRHQQLQQPLQKSLEFLTSMFEDVFIIKPEKNKFQNGIYHFTVSKLEGPRTPFKKTTIRTRTPLDSGRHYLYHQDKLEPLELIPFFKIMESPKGQKDTCYFYNRLEGEKIRLVSYQYDTPSEKKITDDNILSIIKSI